MPSRRDSNIRGAQRRATGAGLDLEDASLTPCTFECPPRSAHPDAPYHRLTQFDGHARITDPAALTAAICRGIGRAQSYGARPAQHRPRLTQCCAAPDPLWNRQESLRWARLHVNATSTCAERASAV
ncbi:type I-E CRISPR-associated protein Cas6/Cse3/CasE [Streptomyces sp. NPDC047085]|uniref:type I-E CRISPR-associated protein Cas6/Cse3/CasE n=1 Tax=Streptomyces sp. NPDC047085 TaxID=3155140 RepID=UPI0033D9A312